MSFVYVLKEQSIFSSPSVVTQFPQENALDFSQTESGRHKAHCLLITLLGREKKKKLKRMFPSNHLFL